MELRGEKEGSLGHRVLTLLVASVHFDQKTIWINPIVLVFLAVEYVRGKGDESKWVVDEPKIHWSLSCHRVRRGALFWEIECYTTNPPPDAFSH